eukprot:m.97615 g.97615  ORF g.97615 m.97615 type:complete len:332 (+) comp10224_c0_seq1:86-1081(+)
MPHDDSDSGSSSSSSEDERLDRKERKKAKKDKKDKKAKKSKDRKRSSEDRDEDHGGKRARVDPSRIEHITDADYFTKNAPFTRWLRKKKGVYFDQLSAERSRELFQDFIVKWNEGSLSDTYYTMDPIKPKTKERTGYTWGFVNKLDKHDKEGLQSLSQAVDYSATHDVLGGTGAQVVSTASAASGSGGRRAVRGPAAPDPEMLQAYSKQLHAKDRRDVRRDHKLVVDELTGGKATGFERKLEKKAEARAERQAREASPDIEGGDPYGGSASTDFASELARRNARAERKRMDRQEAARAKVREHAEREKAKMQELLAMAKANRKEGALYQPS